MGGDGSVENGHNYVFGFNKNGGRLSPVNLRHSGATGWIYEAKARYGVNCN